MSSVLSDSSSSPEPRIVQPKKKSGKAQPKQGVVISTPHGKNEAAQIRISPYEPPEGSVPFQHDVDFGEFDWDSVKDDEDVELWLIRVPDTVCTSILPQFPFVQLTFPRAHTHTHTKIINKTNEDQT